ncbi:HEPN domain-containing protein [Anaerotruncus sp. X29]|nr:HEPN domain-containing protein [Anaerotruncus sp. X29]
MPSENQIELARYRMGKARQCAATARNILFDGDYEASVGRSCFAIFHGMRAVLILDGLDFREGPAVTENFREHYVTTGVFDESSSQIVRKVFDLCTACNYDDSFTVSRQEAEQQEVNACAFLGKVEHYIGKQMRS